MLNYIEYLLKDAPLPREMEMRRRLFIKDDDSVKLLVNVVLETELKIYLDRITDYPLVPHASFDTVLEIISLDADLEPINSSILDATLRRISKSHFSPLWRVASFICDFALEAHRIVNKHAKRTG